MYTYMKMRDGVCKELLVQEAGCGTQDARCGKTLWGWDPHFDCLQALITLKEAAGIKTIK